MTAHRTSMYVVHALACRAFMYVVHASACLIILSTSTFAQTPSRPASPFEPDTLPPHVVQPELAVLLTGIAISIVSNYADFQLQAEQHGWRGLLWERNYRAPKWGAWDWIPHDGYHVAQTTRNTLMLALPIVVHIMGEKLGWNWYEKILATFACYAIGRAIGFSFPYQVNKR